ncbi:putative multiple-sugar transport system permease YteP [Paenibacillus marchantiophytorum]|uniref:Multiple-sugar transport system permease YteP n=1 Tax=Paenibacillus marchantiophytorum TaxID=1619310 RepID=A0ABQ2BTZ5_9BACL|nr:ABC transporter permease subunit [Paenibacillus marchantiophytorum]GGI44943.1 putative multiple-sugar transport system permease YteP [Paenibacillus marchantiophytorum]
MQVSSKHIAMDRETETWSQTKDKKKRSSKYIKQNIPLYIMLTPALVCFILFKYAPMGGIILAFKDYNFWEGIWGSPWVGLKHFDYLFTNPQGWKIIRNTFMLSLLSFIGFPVPILVALMLNEVRKMWFKKIVQTLLYLPHFLSWVIVGGIFITLFSQDTGMVNDVLEKLGFERFAFLYQPFSWITVFISSGIWKEAGFSAIIYLAALTTIDPSLYESTAMDGAGKWRQMWHVSLPGIRPTIILMLILGIGRVMEVGFDHIYVMQNRVVADISEVISTYTFKIGIQGGEFGVPAAMGLFESLVGFTLVLTANQIARKFNQSLW